MPPASPVPGWSSGEVCRLIIARRLMQSPVLSTWSLPSAAPPMSNHDRAPRVPAPVCDGSVCHRVAQGHHAAGRIGPMSNQQPRRTAVVTGASSGIGAATARALAAEGFRVVCAARRTERIEELAAEIGGEAITCDLTDQASVDALAAAVPTVDVLVNNAGGAVGVDRVDGADL